MAWTDITWAFKELVTSAKLGLMVNNDEDLDTRLKLICAGIKAGSINGTSADVTITFSTDCDGGDPNFSSAPRVVAAYNNVSSSYLPFVVSVQSVTNTGFTAHVKAADGSSQNATFNIYFIVIGQTS